MSDLATSYRDHLAILGQRYGAAISAAGYDALVIAAGRAAARNRFDDQHWPLTPTPAFSHWAPLREADAYLVIVPGAPPRLIRTIVADYWEAPAQVDADWLWRGFALTEVRAGELAAALPRGRVAIVSRDDDDGLAADVGDRNPAALLAALDATRVHKTDHELACLALATARAVRGHRAAEALFRTGTPSELQLHLAYLAASDQGEYDTPYQGIVAADRHAAVLHYVNYQKVALTAADASLLVDAGARAHGYGSDITRTYVRGTSPAARRFAALIAAMDELQQRVCAEIQVGLRYEALHDRAHALLAEVLRASGLAPASASVDELVSRGVTRALLPHGLGHSLGISTHDVGMRLTPPRRDNQYLRNTSTIEERQVFTIEPGLYFIDSLLGELRGGDRARLLDWTLVDELARFGGIRIEDNVVVTAAGHRNLTRAAFAAPAA